MDTRHCHVNNFHGNGNKSVLLGHINTS